MSHSNMEKESSEKKRIRKFDFLGLFKDSSEEVKKESNDDISSVSSNFGSNFSDLGIIKTLNAKAKKKKRKSQFCTEPTLPPPLASWRGRRGNLHPCTGKRIKLFIGLHAACSVLCVCARSRSWWRARGVSPAHRSSSVLGGCTS